MTFIKGHSTSTPVPSISADIYWAGSLLTKIVMIMFTQSTAVLRNYLHGELNYFACYNFSQGSTEFPEFSMFREIAEYSRFSRFVPTLN